MARPELKMGCRWAFQLPHVLGSKSINCNISMAFNCALQN